MSGQFSVSNLQFQAMADSVDVHTRNPPMALYVRNGRYLLMIRSDSRSARSAVGIPAQRSCTSTA